MTLKSPFQLKGFYDSMAHIPVMAAWMKWSSSAHPAGTTSFSCSNLYGFLQGKPQPQVTWTKDNQPLDTSRVNIRNTDKDTIFFIRTAQRSDSGKYLLSVRINGAEDKAILDIRVIGMAEDGDLWDCAGRDGARAHVCPLAGGSSWSGWRRRGTAAKQGQGSGVLLPLREGITVGAAGCLPARAHSRSSSLVCCNRVKMH